MAPRDASQLEQEPWTRWEEGMGRGGQGSSAGFLVHQGVTRVLGLARHWAQLLAGRQHQTSTDGCMKALTQGPLPMVVYTDRLLISRKSMKESPSFLLTLLLL